MSSSHFNFYFFFVDHYNIAFDSIVTQKFTHFFGSWAMSFLFCGAIDSETHAILRCFWSGKIEFLRSISFEEKQCHFNYYKHRKKKFNSLFFSLKITHSHSNTIFMMMMMMMIIFDVSQQKNKNFLLCVDVAGEVVSCLIHKTIFIISIYTCCWSFGWWMHAKTKIYSKEIFSCSLM